MFVPVTQWEVAGSPYEVKFVGNVLCRMSKIWCLWTAVVSGYDHVRISQFGSMGWLHDNRDGPLLHIIVLVDA